MAVTAMAEWAPSKIAAVMSKRPTAGHMISQRLLAQRRADGLFASRLLLPVMFLFEQDKMLNSKEKRPRQRKKRKVSLPAPPQRSLRLSPVTASD
jgi:hypothetical protein